MPASRSPRPKPDPDPEYLSTSEMYCPWCGHTCPYHHGEDGCTECACTVTWLGVIAIHLSLQLA
jgi:hypothetical protein